MNKKPAVFIDRDGTINEEMGYINHVSRLRVLPGSADAIRRLNENGVAAVVISNQSGVARGYFPEELVKQVNARLAEILTESGARLDGIYYCPHHPKGEVEEYRKACDCRKPKTGLIDQAVEELGLDLSRSYVVGDRHADIQIAHNAGAKGILVLTGYGRGEWENESEKWEVRPSHVCDDLAAAVDWVLEDLNK